jgi:ATP phosphoribosyltransferase regulatory subunit
MRDLLAGDAEARRALADRVVGAFRRWGYDLVATPPFEHAEVLERGLDATVRRDLLRFVEPDTGEVALLRPDITPQIARIVATHLSERPGPWRLCYEGTVVRRRRGRARRPQQIAQAGIECIGAPGPAADAEVVLAAASALAAAGLTDYRIELGQVHIARDALAVVPDERREEIAGALVRKDGSELELALRDAGVRKRDRDALARLIPLYGPARSVLKQADKTLRSTAAKEALAELTAVIERLERHGLGGCLELDLGELRGQAYYTGVSFTILADGPGEPVGTGGRYDRLLERFGHPAAATGCALDLGNLEWALERSGGRRQGSRETRLVVADPDETLSELAATLREGGTTVARLDRADASAALAFIRAWDYDAAVLSADASDGRRKPAGTAKLVVVRADGKRRRFEPKDVTAWVAWARGEADEG